MLRKNKFVATPTKLQEHWKLPYSSATACMHARIQICCLFVFRHYLLNVALHNLICDLPVIGLEKGATCIIRNTRSNTACPIRNSRASAA